MKLSVSSLRQKDINIRLERVGLIGIELDSLSKIHISYHVVPWNTMNYLILFNHTYSEQPNSSKSHLVLRRAGNK